eukprot:TRINITY_DN112350_c0_g1_i1.p1 TRINITY_DN112350_c0_g1~~TRINITY_DN112350_c0_g1_i1.p1  ORF type:complete len:274 (+),score=61.93 TRINITY_DN112350_c0_g1_i1:64-885(+)
MALADLVGPPVAALCPPGACVFTADWSPAKLVDRKQLTHDTILVTFGLADEGKPLNLSTCACLLTKIMVEGSPDPVVRPYTPVSTNAMIGKFQLVVKVYEGGKVSGHMSTMELGATMDFKHIEKNVKLQYPFAKENITMLVGGTGITPMIQALHAILGTADDKTKVSLIFGNKTQQDILCKDLLDSWAEGFKGRFQVVHVLSNADGDASWTGAKGFIDKACIEAHAAPPAASSLLMVCGPPPMYDALCGPRDKPELTGLLSDMGYSAEQVYKF